MSWFKTISEQRAYDDALNGINNVHYTLEEMDAARHGRQDKMIQEDFAVLGLALRALYKFVLRYVAFLYLGMYIPFQYFDRKHFTFTELFVLIGIGGVITYFIYCIYVYIVRTPLLINKRLGIDNKLYDFIFFILELLLPSLAFSFTFLYATKGIDNMLINLFRVVVAIGLFFFLYRKLKKQIVIHREDAVPLMVKWVYNISKKNNARYNKLTDSERRQKGLK